MGTVTSNQVDVSRPGRSRKVLVICLGQSNNGLTVEFSPTEYEPEDWPDSRISEVSQNITRNRYQIAAENELHLFKHPAQDDDGGICMRLSMGKTMLQLFPDIEHIAFLCVSVGGTGFTSDAPDRWTTDGTLLTGNAVTRANAFLSSNPDFEVVFTHLGGATDATNGHPVATWKANVQAMAAYLRGNITNASNAPWIQGDTHQKLRNIIDFVQPGLGSSYGAEIAALSGSSPWLTNSTSMTMYDLKAGPDDRHLTAPGVREIGRRCAGALYKLGTFASSDASPASVSMSCDMRYDSASSGYRDSAAPGFRISDSYTTETDADMGEVIRFTSGSVNSTGLVTSYTISPTSHTLYALIKIPSGTGNLLSAANNIMSGHFVTGSQDEADSHFFALGTCTNRGAGVNGFATGFATACSTDTVHFVAKTYDGEKNRFYLDGTLISTADSTQGAVDMDYEKQVVRLGNWNESGVSTPPDMKLGAHGIRDYAMSLDDLKELEASIRTAPEEVGAASLMTLNGDAYRGLRRISTANGESATAPNWRNLKNSGHYYEFYVTATITSQDLPFDLYGWSGGTGTPATGIYHLSLEIGQQLAGGIGQGIVTLKYVQQTKIGSGIFVYPEYRAYVQRATETSAWVRQGDWEHIGGHHVSDTGGSGLEVFEVSVDHSNEHIEVTKITPA